MAIWLSRALGAKSFEVTACVLLPYSGRTPRYGRQTIGWVTAKTREKALERAKRIFTKFEGVELAVYTQPVIDLGDWLE